MMYRNKFIGYNKHTTLVADIDNGEAMHLKSQGGMYMGNLSLRLSLAMNLKLL